MAIRNERVVLTLQDDFSTPMARAAATTVLLEQALERLDGSSVRAGHELRETAKATDDLGVAVRRNDASINQLTGRIRVLADLAAILAPAGVAIGAMAVPAITGLAQQLGFAALAGGTMLAAFQGVGDGLEAVNKAALKPTTANLEAARLAMEDLSPAARDFVVRLRETVPALKQIRDTAAEGMFPGLAEGIDGLEQALPRVTRVVEAISGAVGDIAADSGQSLGGERWAEFIDYLGTDGPSALADMAAAVGNVTHAMSELWMAFDPLNDDFSGWLVRATADLDAWSQGLSETQGFAEFVDYIRTNGPRVADALGAIGSAVVGIITAAAPLSGPVLTGLEAVANVISSIAESDLGTPIMAGVAALSLYNRTMAVTANLSKRMGGSDAAGGGFLGNVEKQRTSFAGLRSDLLGYGQATKSVRSAQIDAARAMGNYNGLLQLNNKELARGGKVSQRAQAAVADALGKVEMANFGVAQATEKAAVAQTRQRARLGEMAAAAGKTGAAVGALAVASTGAADGIGLTNTATLGLLGAMTANPFVAAGAATVGLFVDLKASGDAFADSLLQIDAALEQGNLASAGGQLTALQSKLDDWSNVSGPGDAIKDTFAPLGAWMSGDVDLDGWWGVKLSKEAQKTADAVAAARAQVDLFGQFDGLASAGASWSGVISGADGARNSVLGFNQAMALASNALKQDATVDSYRSSMLAVGDALKQNGPTLSRWTKEGLANRTALRGMANEAIGAAQSFTDLGKRDRFLDKARNDFVRTAMAAGASRKEAQALADKYQLLDTIRVNPKVDEQGAGPSARRVQTLRDRIAEIRSKMVNMDEKGAAAARVRIANLRAQIDALQSKSVTITTFYRGVRVGSASTAVDRVDNALGNIFPARRYAMGGFGDVANSHQPELYRGSRTRVWGEEETQGEAYIPLANDHRRPRARNLVEQTAELLGGVAYFADGGLERRRPRKTSSKGKAGDKGGVTTFVFPDPVVSESAAEAAERILAAAQLTVRTTREQRAADLEVLQARQRIDQIAKSLNERETKTVKGKDGKDDNKSKKGMQDKTKKVSYLALRGIDRDVAIAELSEAKLALTDLRARRSETDAILDKIREEREAALEKRRDDAENAISALNDSRTSMRDSLYGTLDLFGRGSSGRSGAAAVTKAIAQIGLFGRVVARLRDANASSALLLQVINQGRQGDFKSAIKFGESLLAEPALISDLNASLGALDAVSSNVATLANDSRVTGIALPGTTAVSNRNTINIPIDVLDVSRIAPEIARIVTHQVNAAIAQLG